MIKLSVVIMTFNEEEHIQDCLDSIKEVANEIIVVDSFSTDRTKEICLNNKVKFIEHEFEGYIEQKRWAIKQASYKHVLSIDADEILSEELIKSIIEVKSNWTKDGYYMNRLNNYCGKWIRHSGWYPDRKLRLLDITKGTWQGHNPHEKAVMNKGTTVGYLKGNLFHYSYFTITEHIDQINNFTSIKAKIDFENNKKANLFKTLLLPLYKFIRWYFFNLGFLDGFFGLVICLNSAHGEFIRYVKLRKMWEEKNN